MSAALGCPRCSAWLEPLHTRSATLLGCRACGGVWLDNASTRRLIDALCDDTLHHADALARFSNPRVDRAAALACPSCRAPLTRWTVPEANIDVDWCEAHGTWFDRDELAGVTRAYAARRAYGGGAALAAGAAVAGGAALGAGMVASDPTLAERARQVGENVDPELVADVGLTALEFVDPVDVVEGAGVVAEGAGSLFGVLGEISSGLDF